jgi:hypothetical protein
MLEGPLHRRTFFFLLFVHLIYFSNMRGGWIRTCYDVIWSLKNAQPFPAFSPKVRLMKRWNYAKIKLFYDSTIKTVHAHCRKISNLFVFAAKQSKNARRASHFYLFLRLVQINLIFSDNVYVLYIYLLGNIFT